MQAKLSRFSDHAQQRSKNIVVQFLDCKLDCRNLLQEPGTGDNIWSILCCILFLNMPRILDQFSSSLLCCIRWSELTKQSCSINRLHKLLNKPLNKYPQFILVGFLS